VSKKSEEGGVTRQWSSQRVSRVLGVEAGKAGRGQTWRCLGFKARELDTVLETVAVLRGLRPHPVSWDMGSEQRPYSPQTCFVALGRSYLSSVRWALSPELL
jgi:hypothetical protein